MIHINRFIDRIKAAEAKHDKSMVLSIQEARDLHGDITKLLLAIQELNERKEKDSEIQNIEISGGNW